MIRYLVIALFTVSLWAPVLGLDLSLAKGVSVKNAFLYSIVALILLESAVVRNRRVELLQVIVPFTMLVAYAIFTWLIIVLLVKYERYSTIGSLIMLKSNFADHLLVFLVCFYGVLRSDHAISLMRQMTWVVIAGSVVTVVDGVNLLDLGLVGVDFGGRVEGLLGEANEYGAFVAFFIPPAIALAVDSRGKTRLFAIAGVMASAVALLLTASRAPILGIVVGSVISAYYLRRAIPAAILLRASLALGIACTAAVLLVMSTEYRYLLEDRLLQSVQGSSVAISSGRTAIWSESLGVMLRQPVVFLTGFGWNAYEAFQFPYAPHSTYLSLLFNLGLIGVTLFVVTIGGTLTRARNAILARQSLDRPYLVALVFGLVCMATNVIFNDLSKAWLFIWAYCGVGMRLVVEAERRAVRHPAVDRQDIGAPVSGTDALRQSGISSRVRQN